MWRTAAARSGTTDADRSRERYSVRWSSSVTGSTPSCAANVASPCTVTPASCRARTTRGTNASATSACTSSDSAALQTDGRCVLAFSTIASAMSRSASRSTYTWQLPTPVSITGTVDSSTTERIRPAPPRGISTSTSPRARISALAASWPSPGTSWTTSAGRPAPAAASRSTATTASFERRALEEPRSSTALPLLRQMPAASAVTLGRAS